VDDILDVVRMEDAQVKLSPRAVAPRAVAEEALSIMGQAARVKGLDLSLHVSGEVDRLVIVDDLRVRQILLALLDNAIKFTDRGRVRLDLDATDAAALRFSVIDTGTGISAEQTETLFQTFGRGDASVTRAHRGMGLGLAICKGLVELMGGRIGLDAKTTVGAAFWFELPVEAVALSEPNPAQPTALATEMEQVSGARVLLVDDHPANRELGATVLSLLGCEVILAETGLEAVAAAHEGRCDLILMDVHMPHMDGLEATRLIRALEGPAGKVPIIGMSADVLPEMEARCLAAGMDEAVGKPIQITALHDVVSRWLAHSREEAQAA
jgi:CheY-like chemotaxis protein